MREEMDRFDLDDDLRDLFAAEKTATEAEPKLPDPAYLYRRALEEEREAARRKALRPIILVERLLLLTIACGAAAAFALFGPEIDWNGLDTVVAAPQVGPVTAASLAGVSLVLLISWLIWAEE